MKDDLLASVLECEGLTAKELAELHNALEPSAASALYRLCEEGHLRREAVRSPGTSYATWRYFKGQGKPGEVPKAFSRARPKKKEPGQPTETGWQARYEAAQARVRELEDWKAKAIARYPDLQVPEEVLRARRIAAKANPDFAKALLAGDKDGSPIMKAVLAAIEEMAA